ncbi:hypothetical protein [Rhodovibrio sodomensis]|uniref:hypothetical protein n=1 Tax=Rhodovibrio sodomensis TaxID=1088 RepID=UPI0019051214|nr:hypothetical protein [Rhodovibrio sodomensis]
MPLPVLQQAWNEAVSSCVATRRSVSVGGATFSASPTRSECISGGIVTRSFEVCVNPFTQSISNTPCNFGEFKETRTGGIQVDGIGPEPQTPVDRPYDVGAVAELDGRVEAGLAARLEVDGGSLDVDYTADTAITVSEMDPEAGDVVELSMAADPVTEGTGLVSRYPEIRAEIGQYVDYDVDAMVRYAGIDRDTGEQIDEIVDIVSFDTTGSVVDNIFSAGVGLTGADVSFFDDPSLTFNLPLSVAYSITNPITPPIGPVPPVSIDIGELLLRTPQMNTPAAPDFDAGVFNLVGGSSIPVPVDRNRITLGTGSVVSTTPSGERDLVSGSVAEAIETGDLRSLALDDGLIDTDFARLDWDVDGTAGSLNPALIFGFNGNIGRGTDPKTGRQQALVSFELNALDLDVVSFFHLDQKLEFKPNLWVDYVFDRPVSVCDEVDCSDPNNFVRRSKVSMPADGTHRISYIQPIGGVSVTPIYSLRNNEFENTLEFLSTLGLQGTALQFKLEGILPALAAGATGLDGFNVAAFQSTPSFEPFLLDTLGDTFPISGFSDIQGRSFQVDTLSAEDRVAIPIPATSVLLFFALIVTAIAMRRGQPSTL